MQPCTQHGEWQAIGPGIIKHLPLCGGPNSRALNEFLALGQFTTDFQWFAITKKNLIHFITCQGLFFLWGLKRYRNVERRPAFSPLHSDSGGEIVPSTLVLWPTCQSLNFSCLFTHQKQGGEEVCLASMESQGTGRDNRVYILPGKQQLRSVLDSKHHNP